MKKSLQIGLKLCFNLSLIQKCYLFQVEDFSEIQKGQVASDAHDNYHKHLPITSATNYYLKTFFILGN